MTAPRPARREETTDATPAAVPPPEDSADWLTLQQAACEMGASMSTVRRMVRSGRLLNRMVPHRGGFAYLVFIPGSRHGAQKQTQPKRRRLWLIKPHESSDVPADDVDTAHRITELERQLDQMAHALSRALRTKQRALPEGMGDPDVNPSNPYARYRWLRRKRRWRLPLWPFGS